MHDRPGLRRAAALASGTTLVLGALSLTASPAHAADDAAAPPAPAEVTSGTLRWVLPGGGTHAVSVDGGAAVDGDGRTVTLGRANGRVDASGATGEVAFGGRIHLTATDGSGVRTTVSDVHVELAADGTAAIVADYAVAAPDAEKADERRDVRIADLPVVEVDAGDSSVTVTAPEAALTEDAPGILTAAPPADGSTDGTTGSTDGGTDGEAAEGADGTGGGSGTDGGPAVPAVPAPSLAAGGDGAVLAAGAGQVRLASLPSASAVALDLTTRAAPAAAATGDASATTNAKSVEAGGTLGFSVKGFPAGETLTVKLDDGEILQQFTVKSDGTYAGSVTVPAATEAGSHWLRFLAPNPPTSVKGDAFTVTEPSSGSGGSTSGGSGDSGGTGGTGSGAPGSSTGPDSGSTGSTSSTGGAPSAKDSGTGSGGRLADTGTDATAPLAAAGFLVAAGGAAVAAARRRPADAS
ncbi:HtaA domain-containing protein [Streptomyces sp. HB2AG]|uniref:HtaA domain-containing protein n=1 Tax=Streptomyces sp. HB2AG TaxID=2983400 RepID=UPI0022AAA59E|nr:HtaA domain-containing protein [Streptomyces sp. HB2AG]MCZ2527164.1 HtaA domain-containing protein [Streptomyces sp. HB2AG]